MRFRFWPMELLGYFIKSYHAVNLQLVFEVVHDIVQLDKVGEVKRASHQGVVCGNHLADYNLSSISYHQQEVMYGSI